MNWVCVLVNSSNKRPLWPSAAFPSLLYIFLPLFVRTQQNILKYLYFSRILLKECEWWIISSGSWSPPLLISSKLQLLFLQVCVDRHLVYSRAPERERTVWPRELTAHNLSHFLWTFDLCQFPTYWASELWRIQCKPSQKQGKVWEQLHNLKSPV